MNPRVDVAIAGSGPAGAATALRLARAGISVALIDPRAFPRDKLCGEYLNLGAIRELRDLDAESTLLPHAQPLDGLRLFAHGESAEFALPSEAWSIPRTVLDKQLRDLALQAGAQALQGRVHRLQLGTTAVGVEWLDATGNAQTLSANYLVGADGMQSKVAKLCNLAAPIAERRFAIGAHYRGVDLGRWIEMYASGGEYFALNPLDESSANAVFVLEKTRLMRAREALYTELTAFSESVTAGRRALQESGFVANCHAVGPLAHRTVRPTLKRVLLVGDAAAFVDPFTGQGVYLALAGARDAASAIAQALAHPEREHVAWHGYASALQQRISERRRVAVMMKLMLAVRCGAHRAARALRKRPDDFAMLIDAVCGNSEAPGALRLAAAVGKALR
jgi:menaquinone-9 beta-reductase